MKDQKKKKQDKFSKLILVLIGVFAVSPIFVAMSVTFSLEWINIAGGNEWIGFWGGYVGAVFGSLITYYIFRRTMIETKEIEAGKEKVEFFRYITEVITEYKMYSLHSMNASYTAAIYHLKLDSNEILKTDHADMNDAVDKVNTAEKYYDIAMAQLKSRNREYALCQELCLNLYKAQMRSISFLENYGKGLSLIDGDDIWDELGDSFEEFDKLIAYLSEVVRINTQ